MKIDSSNPMFPKIFKKARPNVKAEHSKTI